MSRNISTTGRCYGLSVCEDKIAVCVRRVNQSVFAVYDKRKEVLINEIHISTPRISGICYIAFGCNGKNMIYSDDLDNTVTCVKADTGKELWRKTSKCPKGIGVFDNIILVANGRNNNLEKISIDKLQCNISAGLQCIEVKRDLASILVSTAEGVAILMHIK